MLTCALRAGERDCTYNLGAEHQSKLPPSVILSEAKDLVLLGQGHPPCQSSLTSRHSGLIDSIKAIFFAPAPTDGAGLFLRLMRIRVLFLLLAPALDYRCQALTLAAALDRDYFRSLGCRLFV